MTTDPKKIRDMNFREIRDQLAGPREQIWQWLYALGPHTTTAISGGTQIPLLTVRPRVCELVAMGFAECVGRERREGIYRAVTVAEAQAKWDAQRTEAQLPLKL